jgi:flagellar hook-length control protein FliK
MNAGQIIMSLMQSGAQSVTPAAPPAGLAEMGSQQGIGVDFAKLLNGMQVAAGQLPGAGEATEVVSESVKTKDTESIDAISVLIPQNAEMYVAAQMSLINQRLQGGTPEEACAVVVETTVDRAQNVPVSAAQKEHVVNVAPEQNAVVPSAVPTKEAVAVTGKQPMPQTVEASVELAAKAVPIQASPTAVQAATITTEQPQMKLAAAPSEPNQQNRVSSIPEPSRDQLPEQPVLSAEVTKPVVQNNETAQNVPVSAAQKEHVVNVIQAQTVVVTPTELIKQEAVAVMEQQPMPSLAAESTKQEVTAASVQPQARPTAVQTAAVMTEQPQMKLTAAPSEPNQQNRVSSIPEPSREKLPEQPARSAEVTKPAIQNNDKVQNVPVSAAQKEQVVNVAPEQNAVVSSAVPTKEAVAVMEKQPMSSAVEPAVDQEVQATLPQSQPRPVAADKQVERILNAQFIAADLVTEPVSSKLQPVDASASILTEQSSIQSEAPASTVKIATQSQVMSAYAVRTPIPVTNPDAQAEKQPLQNQQVAVKEMTATLPNAVSAVQGPLASDDLLDKDAERSALDQGMNGQLLVQKPHEQPKTGFTAAPSVVADKQQEIPEQVMHQVRERLAQHDVKPGNQQITLTLSPDSLGELKMNLNLQGQKLSVEIVTENRAARDAIVQHTDALKESLARQNITMESFDVTTGGKGSGSQGQNQNAWRELAKQQQQQQFWTSTGGYRNHQASAATNLPAYSPKKEHAMLDIHY